MKYTIEIKKVEFGHDCVKVVGLWEFELYIDGYVVLNLYDYKTTEAALEAAQKGLLKRIIPVTFDFGQGNVSAHKHPNGSGWVADTAHVDDTAFVGPDAQVFDNARVCGHSRILDYAKVYENAYVYGFAQINGNSFIHGRAFIYGNSIVFSARVSGKVKLTDQTRVCPKSFLC